MQNLFIVFFSWKNSNFKLLFINYISFSNITRLNILTRADLELGPSLWKGQSSSFIILCSFNQMYNYFDVLKGTFSRFAPMFLLEFLQTLIHTTYTLSANNKLKQILGDDLNLARRSTSKELQVDFLVSATLLRRCQPVVTCWSCFRFQESRDPL